MAHYRIREHGAERQLSKGGVQRTPCVFSSLLSEMLDCEVWLKHEYSHHTGSFKERGARNALMKLSSEAKEKGVVCASAGNHALGLSYHAKNLGIPVTVVMPDIAPLTKVNKCRKLGADVQTFGQHLAEARQRADELASSHGYTYINGFDHPDIISGAGTMGIELLEDVPHVDAVVVPIGGGGLIAGTALAIKSLRPEVQIYGAESEACASWSAAMKAGQPVEIAVESTLADGLAVSCVGPTSFQVGEKLIDEVVQVQEKHIALAVLRLLEGEKTVCEGGGCTGLAALLAGLLPQVQGKCVVVPLCGGNIDTTVLGRCIERGLAADGRLIRFVTQVSDRPGGIASLLRLLADLGVSIKDVFHERAWLESDIFSVQVKCVVETRDWEHVKEVQDNLRNEGYNCVFGSWDGSTAWNRTNSASFNATTA